MRFIDPAMPSPADRLARVRVLAIRAAFSRFRRARAALDTGVGNEADLGTAFALATSLYGSNNLQVSGNVGYGSQTGVPAAAFRTSYSRDLMGGSPEVSLTMRQLFLPGPPGGGHVRVTKPLCPCCAPCPAASTTSTQLSDNSPCSMASRWTACRSWIT